MAANVSQRETILNAAVLVALTAIGWLGYTWYRKSAGCCDSGEVRLTAPIPLDREIRTGRLGNGLTYFVRENYWPEKRVELRLVVNAGAVLEDDDQRGLAHALEHMAFRGTRQFPGRRIIDYLESIGSRYGDDLNATTSQDETTYELSIPGERPEALDTAITILSEWAHAISLDSATARQEAGVVFEEWRSKASVARRLSLERMTFLLGDSKYAKRPTLGDTAVLRRFDLNAMRRFYREWYRPELMAVVVVGDIDAVRAEALVRKRFGKIPRSETPKERPAIAAAVRDSSRALVLTDPEAVATRVAIWHLRPRKRMATLADYRESLITELWHNIASARLDKASRPVESPLLRANATHQEYVRPMDLFLAQGTVTEGRVQDGVALLAEHITGSAAFGPTEAELELAKKSLQDERTDADSHGHSSSDWVDALVAHFLTGAPAIGVEQDYEIVKTILSQVTATDVRKFAGEFAVGRNEAIMVTAAPRRRSGLADGGGPLALLGAARRGAMTASRPDTSAEKLPVLLAKAPVPGRIISEALQREATVFDFRLDNGMRVLVKPTQYADAQVQMRITAPVGAAIAGRAAYASAYHSDDVIEVMGIGPITGTQLASIIANTSITLSPTVSDTWLQFSGQAELKDVETLFQLIHLYFTAPRRDALAFQRYQERFRLSSAERTADAEAVFDDAVSAASSLRPRWLSPAILSDADAVDLNAATSYWRSRTANAASFTAVIVGDIRIERAKGLITKYLASLPGGHAEAAPSLVGPMFDRRSERELTFGEGQAGRTEFLFGGTAIPGEEAMFWRVHELLQLVLENRLREFMGATYGVDISHRIKPSSARRFEFSVDFSGDPARMDTLARVAIAEIDRLRTAGPTMEEFDKVRAAAKSDLGSNLTLNSWWATDITWRALMGGEFTTGRDREVELELLSPAALRDACARYLDTSKYFRLTMRPKR